MSFFKKMFGLGAATAITVAGAAQEAPKTEKLTTETTKTIAYNNPSKTVEAASYTASKTNLEAKKTIKQELEQARINLVKTQLEFKSSIAELQEKFKHDAFTLGKINEIADYDVKISVFAKNFTDGITEDIDGVEDSKNLETYIQQAKKYSKDPRSSTGQKAKVLNELSKGVLGSVVFQEGYNGSVDGAGNPAAYGNGVTKDEVTRALWVGDSNLPDRLLTAEIIVKAKEAALEKQNSMDLAVNNVNHLDTNSLASK